MIDRCGIFGENQRVTDVGIGHHGAEADRVCVRRNAGESRVRGVPGLVPVAAPGQVVVGPEVVVAEFLYTLGHPDGLRPRIGGEE